MVWRQDLKFVGLVAIIAPPIGLLVLYVGWFAFWPESYPLRRIGETLAGFPIALVFAYPLAIGPAVVGAALIRVARHLLPESWQSTRLKLFTLGATVGGIVGGPMVLAMYTPAQQPQPRVLALSLLVGGVTGGLCASNLAVSRSRLPALRWSGP